MVDWTKPIQDERGRPARLVGIAREEGGKNCRVVAVDYGDREVVLCFWYCGEEVHGDSAITNVPVRRTVYLNFYDAGTDCVPICSVHDTKELADSVGGGCMVKVACVKVTYTEGEGLE